ncbi:MAG: ROK family glucokinase [Microbacteriaceae bacterium]
MYAVGIDIGGTKIAGALVDEAGNIIRENRVPTPAHDPDAIADAVVELIRELADGVEVIAAGVAAAGFVDASRANIVYAPNLSWRNEPLKAKIQARIDIPVFIDNDANAAAWAEYRFGAGAEAKHVIMLTIGTGVGGAVIVNGQLLRGGFGIAAELGHVPLKGGDRLCGCGQYGCIEAYGSGTVLLRSARELVESGDPAGSRLSAIAEEAGELTGLQVYQAITEHDPGALGLLRELGAALGKSVAGICAVLDPELVIIGGGVSAAGNLLLDPIRESYLKHLSAADYRPHAKFAIAQLVNDAGVVGAADLARLELATQ